MGSIKRKIAGRCLMLSLMMLFFGGLTASAQTFAEWWSQKKTQRKYLVQQIAALQMYGGYLKKGYDIAGHGLQTVKGFTGGEFNLHKTFISSLKAVSPAVCNNAKVAEIITMQLAISHAFAIKSNSMLSLSDQDYIKNVKEKVMEECGKDLEELLLVITAGKVEMNDDERLERLDKVYIAMQDKAAFTQSFCNQAGLLIRQRAGEQRSIDQLNNNYEIN